MLKFAGLILLTAASSGVGILYASKAGRRVHELSQLVLMIKEIETRIRFEQPEISLLLKSIAGRQEYKAIEFLPLCCENLETKDFPSAFSGAAEKAKKTMALKEDDWKPVMTFFSSLGVTDTEGQLSNCRMHEALLGERLEDAKKEQKDKSKLYVSLGVFGGLAASIMLI